MKSRLIFLFIVFPILLFSQKKETEGLRLYNLGVKYFKENRIKEADSCFAKSADLEFFVDTYYNLAMCKKKLNDMEKYCHYLEICRRWGDVDSKDLFSTECVRLDSFFVDSNMRKADFESYAFKIKYYNSNFTSTREFEKTDRSGKINLKYRITEKDTIYWVLPNEEDVFELKKVFLLKVDKAIVYPKYEKKHNIGGVVNVIFDVDKTGKISNIGKKGWYFKGLAEETERVINLIGNFGIVKLEGKPINYRVTLPVNFNPK